MLTTAPKTKKAKERVLTSSPAAFAGNIETSLIAIAALGCSSSHFRTKIRQLNQDDPTATTASSSTLYLQQQ